MVYGPVLHVSRGRGHSGTWAAIAEAMAAKMNGLVSMLCCAMHRTMTDSGSRTPV